MHCVIRRPAKPIVAQNVSVVAEPAMSVALPSQPEHARAALSDNRLIERQEEPPLDLLVAS